jgi:hypothetical protein
MNGVDILRSLMTARIAHFHVMVRSSTASPCAQATHRQQFVQIHVQL